MFTLQRKDLSHFCDRTCLRLKIAARRLYTFSIFLRGFIRLEFSCYLSGGFNEYDEGSKYIFLGTNLYVEYFAIIHMECVT